MKYGFLWTGFIVVLGGCGNTTPPDQQSKLNYFDIRGYFEQESARLTRSNPLIRKTVMVDGATETKSLRIADWKKELSIFSDADMNKASWKGQFKLTREADQEVYVSDNEKVPVKKVTIMHKNNGLYGLQILIKNTNSLYTSIDTLTYYRDSLYQVIKTQNIRLLPGKNYRITGEFKAAGPGS